MKSNLKKHCKSKKSKIKLQQQNTNNVELLFKMAKQANILIKNLTEKEFMPDEDLRYIRDLTEAHLLLKRTPKQLIPYAISIEHLNAVLQIYTKLSTNKEICLVFLQTALEGYYWAISCNSINYQLKAFIHKLSQVIDFSYSMYGQTESVLSLALNDFIYWNIKWISVIPSLKDIRSSWTQIKNSQT